MEKYYSNGINKLVIQFLSILTGIFPFSIAEILVIITISLILVYLIRTIFILLKRKKNIKQELLNFIINSTCFISLIYSFFLFLWGFNYQRVSFDKILNFNIHDINSKDLYLLCDELINEANNLRKNVDVNSQGIMYIKNGYKDVFKRAADAYKNAAVAHKELSGKYGMPKPIILSKPMCYTGITGIYFPFTGEANVNINIRDFMLPCTATHEMAHQRGFAREDEANYIAYLTCIGSDDIDFQYSGTMLALIYSMNALSDTAPNAYAKLKTKYSDGVLKDLRDDIQFWNAYSGKIEKFSDSLNNSYLKSNGQKDGVKSYGRMVDLLIAEFRKKNYTLIKKYQ